MSHTLPAPSPPAERSRALASDPHRPGRVNGSEVAAIAVTRRERIQAALREQAPVPPRRPFAFLRAGAHLVLLSASLIACTRPYCRFIVRRQGSGLAVLHVRPDGVFTSHVLPLPVLGGEPDLVALAEHVNQLGCDPLTGRQDLVPLEPKGTTRTARNGDVAHRQDPVEYVKCHAQLHNHPETGESELHLWLPLVLRVWRNGHIDAYTPQSEATEEQVWSEF